MKDSLAPPGGPLTSKPTWFRPSGCRTTSAFFVRAPNEEHDDQARIQPATGIRPGNGGSSFAHSSADRDYPGAAHNDPGAVVRQEEARGEPQGGEAADCAR